MEARPAKGSLASVHDSKTFQTIFPHNDVLKVDSEYNATSGFVSVVNTHSIDITAKFAVSIKEKQDRLPTLYWLPKLHKRPYKARFIANSSSCTTTNLSKLLTLCLTAVKKHWIRYYDTVYERDGINYFWSIKNSNEVLNKFKSKTFQASKLSTYDFFLHCILRYLIIL